MVGVLETTVNTEYPLITPGGGTEERIVAGVQPSSRWWEGQRHRVKKGRQVVVSWSLDRSGVL